MSNTPASITLAAVGASVCASGSHVCSGHVGSLTAKATKKSQNSHDRGSSVAADASAPLFADNSIRLKLPTSGVRNTATMATSMNALPRMVKIRNFIAEYSLRPVPQMEMSMYIGSSSSSQNRKNNSRSIAVKTPMTADWSNSNQMKYSLTRSPTCHDASTADRPSSPVSATSGADSPSTASRYDAFSPTSGIQANWSTNWKRVASSPRSNSAKTSSASTKSTTAMATAAPRMTLFPRSSNSSTAPTAGRNTVAVSSPLNSGAISFRY